MNLPEKASFEKIYGETEKCTERFQNLAEKFAKIYKHDHADFFTSPGRTEIIGNHVDHNGGKVIAGSINLDTIGAAAPNGTNVIHITSEGYRDEIVVDLDRISRANYPKGTFALLAGMMEGAKKNGFKTAGFDAYVSTNVIAAAGVSSSASFEMLIMVIIDYFFNDSKMTYTDYAKIGQYAENVYYGKPSGLMDQMASSVGGLVFIDFNDPKTPIVEKVDYVFAHSGYTLCTIDSGADHADLTDEYAAMPIEMKKVAKFFGKEVLREVDEQEFYAKIAEIRKETGDRAVLRAIHFFNENRRVQMQVRALKNDNFDAFLHYVNESGMASWTLLQNVTPAGYIEKQDMAFTIALCQQLLGGEGAIRVHGGGFAGTALAFVPNEKFEQFKTAIEAALGSGCCHKLAITE